MRWALATTIASDIAWALRRMPREHARRASEETWPVLQALRLGRAHGEMGEAIAAARWTMAALADVRLALGCLMEAP